MKNNIFIKIFKNLNYIDKLSIFVTIFFLILVLLKPPVSYLIFSNSYIISFLTIVTIVFLLITIVVNIVRIFIHYKIFYKYLILVLFGGFAFISITLYPSNYIYSLFKGKPILKAYYEGTQNQATLTFRTNNIFDIHWTGWGGSTTLYYGTFTNISSDQYYLTFKSSIPRGFNGYAIITNAYWYANEIGLQSTNNSKKRYHYFEIYYPVEILYNLSGMSDNQIKRYFNKMISQNKIFIYKGGYANTPLVNVLYLPLIENVYKISVGCDGGVMEAEKFNNLMIKHIQKNKK